MDAEERRDMLNQAKANQKLGQLLEHQEQFQEMFAAEMSKMPLSKPFQLKESEDSSSEMTVCVRVRPRLEHEVSAGYFSCVSVSNPSIKLLNPSVDFKGRAKVSASNFNVDMSFGPQDTNDTIYNAIVQPVVDLSLQGGIGSLLAYGQTGSGKTYTISGLLQLIASDLFLRQDRVSGEIKVYLSLFELLGDSMRDLLQPDSNSKVSAMVDKFGKVNVVGAEEVELTDANHLIQLVDKAASHRKTSPTFKNDTSSRSHAIYKIRIENTFYKSAEDGCLFVMDLAGSESTADSKFHDKERLKECRLINTSLMTLKECIINRAKSSQDMNSHFHIPFRQSKLTLLMRDAFELESNKVCKTVVFANVAPTVADVAMSLNTLRYVTPIKEGMRNRKKLVPNPNNPANWSNEQMSDWVLKHSKSKVDPKVLCPWESGKQLLQLPEIEFLKRVMESNPQIGPKEAKVFYQKLWKCLIDARTADRKRHMKQVKKTTAITAQEYFETAKKEEAEAASRSVFQAWLEDNLMAKGVTFAMIGIDNSVIAVADKKVQFPREELAYELVNTVEACKSGAVNCSFYSVCYERVSCSEGTFWRGSSPEGVIQIEVTGRYSLLTMMLKNVAGGNVTLSHLQPLTIACFQFLQDKTRAEAANQIGDH